METSKIRNLKFKLSLALVVACLSLSAQNLEIPQKEFNVSFSKDQLSLSRGETSEINVGILRSKQYRSSKAKMEVSSTVPKDVTIVFAPEKGDFDFTRATISVGKDAIPGSYLLIVSATLNYKTKGSILKLEIN